MKPYPLFIPPPKIAEKDPQTWSKDEAKQYFDWMVSVIPTRTAFLLEFFGETETHHPEALLVRLGENVGAAVASGGFADKGKPTDEGFALAADLGLLVGRLLLESPSVEARWVLVTQKRNLHFNYPVLQGNTKVQLNPVTGSITEFGYAIRNGWDSEIWSKMFSHWKNVFSPSQATQT